MNTEHERSHLKSLELRLLFNAERYLLAETKREKKYRHAQVKQIQREIDAEYKFLGIEPAETADGLLLNELLK